MSHIPAERCLDIITLLAEGAATLPLGEIAERLGLPKSGAHRLLATLVDLGWAEQDANTGFYRLTMRLVILGQRYYVATGIPDICQPLLDRLAAKSREFARLAVVDGDSLTWLAHAQGATGGLLYQPSLKSNKVPLHVTATGKSWLASLPRDVALQHVLKAGLRKASHFGPGAVTSVDALMDELDATAKRGYGVAINEAEPGVTAVACVVTNADGGAVGTVSVAGPGARIGPERVEELGAMVMSSARELAGLWPLRPRTLADLGAGTLAEA